MIFGNKEIGFTASVKAEYVKTLRIDKYYIYYMESIYK